MLDTDVEAKAEAEVVTAVHNASELQMLGTALAAQWKVMSMLTLTDLLPGLPKVVFRAARSCRRARASD